MDVWLRVEAAADELARLGDLSADPYDRDVHRIYDKILAFRNAIHEEAVIHDKQALIDSSENEAIRQTLGAVDRSSSWRP